MKNRNWTIWAAGAALLLGAASMQAQQQAQGRTVVTVLSKHEGKPAPAVKAEDFSFKVNGRAAEVAGWKPYAADSKVELTILIDSSLHSSIGQQYGEIEQFVKSLPPNVHAAIAYMMNGRSIFGGPFSADHAEVLKNLHLSTGSYGSSGSPYFCLSELAKKWPSQDKETRRVVVMITDGVDSYHPAFDPDDPYVQAAIRDSVRAHLAVYSIYWQNPLARGNFAGQSLLLQVADATGGRSFYQGTNNPVSFTPYFDKLKESLQHQYLLEVKTVLKEKPEVEDLRAKFHLPGTEVNVPQRILLEPLTK